MTFVESYIVTFVVVVVVVVEKDPVASFEKKNSLEKLFVVVVVEKGYIVMAFGVVENNPLEPPSVKKLLHIATYDLQPLAHHINLSVL